MTDEKLSLAEKYPSEITLKVVKKLAERHGRGGDIFRPETLDSIHFVLLSWFEVMGREKPYYTEQTSERTARRLKYKIACALHQAGQLVLDPDVFCTRQDTSFTLRSLS
jgi:hypothetical protein